MKAWLPALIIGIGLLLAAVFNLVAAFMSRRTLKKQLDAAGKTIETLTRNMETASKSLGEARQETENCKAALGQARRDVKEANLRANDQEGQREGLYKLYQESKRELANLAWLAHLAEEQAKDISRHVKATVVTYPHTGSLVLSGEDHLCVTVGLAITNESVFDITIRPQDITGSS